MKPHPQQKPPSPDLGTKKKESFSTFILFKPLPLA